MDQPDRSDRYPEAERDDKPHHDAVSTQESSYQKFRSHQALSTQHESVCRNVASENIPSAPINASEKATLIDALGKIEIPPTTEGKSTYFQSETIHHGLPVAPLESDASQPLANTVELEPSQPKEPTKDLDIPANHTDDPEDAELAFIREFYLSRIKRAEEMSLEDRRLLAENLRAQDEGLKKGQPKAPRLPIWKNPGVKRGAVIRMPIVQLACDPNSKEDRRRTVTEMGFVDASSRFVVVQGVFRRHIIASIVTTRNGNGSRGGGLTDMDQRWWGALREIGNPEMRSERVDRTIDMKMHRHRKDRLRSGSVFRLHGTPLDLPAGYISVGHLTKEGLAALPMPLGCDGNGWEIGYASEVPSFTWEIKPYKDFDGPPPRQQSVLDYDDQIPLDAGSKSRSSLEEGQIISDDHAALSDDSDAFSVAHNDVHDRGGALEDKDHLRHHTRKRGRSPESDDAAARQSHKKHKDAFGKPGKRTKEHVYESANEDETPASGRSPFARSERSNRRTDDYRSKNRIYGGADSGRHYRRRDRDSRGGGR